jgi:tetratricopeptide (TPR) repeat protein
MLEDPATLLNLGKVLQFRFEMAEGSEGVELATVALKAFRDSLDLRPGSSEAMCGVGNSLAHLSLAAEGREEALRLNLEAEQAFRECVNLVPDDDGFLFNLAGTLAFQSELVEADQWAELADQSIDLYKRAFELSPPDEASLREFWSFLLKHSYRVDRDEAIALAMEAERVCRRFLRSEPRNAGAQLMLGNALFRRSDLTSGREERKLELMAEKAIRQSLEIDPDQALAYNSLGVVLSWRAVHASEEEEARALASEAAEFLRRAASLQPGLAGYDYACLAAMVGDVTTSRRILEEMASEHSLPPRSILLADGRLQRIREEEWFEDLVQAAPDGPQATAL